MDNNNNDNNTIKIISWNVNAFCKTDNWNDLSTEKLKEKQDEYSENIIQGIKCLINEIEDDGILFLQEVPKRSNAEIIEILENNFSEYEIKDNLPKNRRPDICTIAIYKNRSNWENIFFNTSKAIYKKKESLYYYNRCVLLKSKMSQIQVLGVHIPSVYHDPSALLLWDDIIEFARTEEPHIIIGDFNADAEDTPQWRCMKELMNLDKRQKKYYPKRNPKYTTYIEPEGDAKRKKIGEPKTYHYKDENGEEEGSHVDYALIREDIMDKVDSYTITKELKTVEDGKIDTIDFGKLSDHYPIMLEINLNNDKEEA